MLYWNTNIAGEDFSLPWVKSSPISGAEFYIWYDGYNPQTTHPCARSSAQWGDIRKDNDYKVMFEIAGVPIYGKSDKYFTPENSGHRYLYIKQNGEYVQLYHIQSNQGMAVGYPNTADFFKFTGIFLYFSHNYDGLETEPTRPRLQDLYISWQFYSEYRIQRSIYDDHTYIKPVSPSVIMNYSYTTNTFDALAQSMGALYYRVIKGDTSPDLNIGQILVDRGLLTEQEFSNWLDEIETEVENGDDDGGGTGANFGGGSWDDSSDDIGFSELPTVSVASSGLVKMFNPSETELHQLGSFLFSDDIVRNLLKALYQPLDHIISLSLVPFVPDAPTSDTIRFLWYNTGILCPKITHSYQIIDAGSYTLQGYYGSFLDYNSRVYLFVPFCGMKEIDGKLAINSTITLQYKVDTFTGDCLCQVKFTKGDVDSTDFNSVVYHYRGNLSAQIPLFARDFSQTIKNVVSGAIAGASHSLAGVYGASMELFNNGLADIGNVGNMTNNSALMDSFTPYILVKSPVQSKPTNYVNRLGITSNIYYRLGDLSGFVRIVSGTFENDVNCTDAERNEINELLEGGVYIE